MTQLRVLIAGDFPFPIGNASSSRVLHIAKGLSRSNWHVTVLSIWEPGYETLNDSNLSLLSQENINKLYLKKTNGNSNSLKAIYHFTYEFFQKNNIDFLIIYDGPIEIALPLFVAAKRNKVSVILEICEWFPASTYLYYAMKKYYWYISELAYRIIMPIISDGVIVISTYIDRKLRLINRKRIIIPALGAPHFVDTGKLDNGDNIFSVVYTGKFKIEDSAYILIEAVRICSERGLRITLEMIGDFNQEDGPYCINLVQSSNLLSNIVKFTGNLLGEDYYHKIQSASCLVLIRPSNKVNLANFPTRLPEFLFTGNPVIVSSVGDIEKYIKRGIHAHVIDDVNPESLAEAISYIYYNKKYSKDLGDNGRILAEKSFDYKKYGNALSCFLHNILDKR